MNFAEVWLGLVGADLHTQNTGSTGEPRDRLIGPGTRSTIPLVPKYTIEQFL